MPRAGLDTEIVVRRASAIIDEVGPGGLTLARLAGELGVATPSLYKHVAGLDDLIARVAAAATAELAEQLGVAARGRSGRAALNAVAQAYRRFAREHPGTYPLTQRTVTSAEWQTAASDAVGSFVAALWEYGITEEDTHLVRFIRATLHGFVDLERSGGFALPASVDQSFTFLIDSLDATLRTPDTV
jgi:AcrR family transcriptional regulator